MTWREFRLTITDDLVARFDASVDRISTPEGCHLWSGTKINAFGHGGFNIGYDQQGQHHYAPAHRVAWVIGSGSQVIPPRIVVRHRPVLCTSPSCVRFEHLMLGTVTQNMLDKREAGTHVCGEANYNAKLTEQDVRDIRARYIAGDGTAEMIAEDYDVSGALIVQILAGKIWTHVTGGVSVTMPRWRPKLRPKPLSCYDRGSQHARSVHTENDVLELVSVVRAGETVAEAARQLSFTESSARQIMSGRSWSHVTGIEKR